MSVVAVDHIVDKAQLDPPGAARRQRHVQQACDRCRRKRARCDGEKPRCGACVSTDDLCSYSTPDRRRVDVRDAHIRGLQHRVNQAESALQVLRYGSEREARQALFALRHFPVGQSPNSLPETPIEPALEPISLPIHLSPRTAEAIYADKDGSIPPNAAAFVLNEAEIYDHVHLPPEAMVRKGAKFFFGVVAGLFHIMDVREFDTICQNIYGKGAEPSNTMVAELCAVAAVGAHYDPDGVDERIKMLLFRTGLSQVNAMIDEDAHRALRTIACLCGYGMVTKRRSTPYLIQLGLRLARRSMARPEHSNSLTLQKLYRTMIFFECWLATTIGYEPDLLNVNLPAMKTSLGPAGSGNEDETTQAKVSEVGLLRLQVLCQMCCGVQSAEDIEMMMTRLNDWHYALPPFMSFTYLMQGNMSPFTYSQRGALILAHSWYLSSVVVLHQPVLVAIADARLEQPWYLPEVDKFQAQAFFTRAVEAARSMVRIYILLEFGTQKNNMHIRSWLSTFDIYIACSVLMFELVVLIMSGEELVSASNEDFDRISQCILMLESSSGLDLISRRLYTLMAPIHQTMLTLIGQSPERPGAFHFRRPTDTTFQLLYDIAEILKDPFGHGSELGFTLVARDATPGYADWWTSSPSTVGQGL